MDLDLGGWSDERTAIAAGVVVLAVVSIAGVVLEVPFGTRSFLAIAAGFVALIVTSYALTGSAIPPDDRDR